MNSEAARPAHAGDARRALLASLTLEHQIDRCDPLAPPDAGREAAFADALLDEQAVAPARVAALLSGQDAQ